MNDNIPECDKCEHFIQAENRRLRNGRIIPMSKCKLANRWKDMYRGNPYSPLWCPRRKNKEIK